MDNGDKNEDDDEDDCEDNKKEQNWRLTNYLDDKEDQLNDNIGPMAET